MCVNVLGEEVNATKVCETSCDDCDLKTVYITGNLGKISCCFFYFNKYTFTYNFL